MEHMPGTRRIKLDLADLQVESFEPLAATQRAPGGRGKASGTETRETLRRFAHFVEPRIRVN